MQARRLLGDLSVRGMQGVLAFGKKNKKTFLELEKAGLDLSEQIDTNCLMTQIFPMRIGPNRCRVKPSCQDVPGFGASATAKSPHPKLCHNLSSKFWMQISRSQ